jgi:hypothetical protein
MHLPSGGLIDRVGTSGGRPILFLRGVGGGAWSWRPQIAELGADFACYGWEANERLRRFLGEQIVT